MGGGADGAIGVGVEQGGAGVDQQRIDQRLVALHIDHHVVAAQAELDAGLGESVAAAGVVDAGQQRTHAMQLAGRDDACMVGGDDHLLCLRLCGTLRYPHHHRQPADVGQRLVGQPGGCQACGNDD